MAQHEAQQTLRLIDVIDFPQTTNTILIGMFKKNDMVTLCHTDIDVLICKTFIRVDGLIIFSYVSSLTTHAVGLDGFYIHHITVV